MAGLADIYRQLSPAERGRHVPGQVFWIPAYGTMQDYHAVSYTHLTLPTIYSV